MPLPSMNKSLNQMGLSPALPIRINNGGIGSSNTPSSAANSEADWSWIVPVIFIGGAIALFVWFTKTTASPTTPAAPTTSSKPPVPAVNPPASSQVSPPVSETPVPLVEAMANPASEAPGPSSWRKLESANEAMKILQSTTKPIVVGFFSETCGPCIATKGPFEQAAAQMKDRPLNVYSLYIQSDPQMMEVYKAFNIQGYPTILKIQQGKVLDELRGERSVSAFKQFMSA